MEWRTGVPPVSRSAGESPATTQDHCHQTLSAVRSALQSRCFELIALLPAHQLRRTGCLPSQREAEARHHRIAGEIRVGMILIAGLVIVLLGVFVRLLHSPRRIVAFVLHAFIDRKRGNAHTGQAEVIGAIVVSRLGMRIGTNRQTKFLGQRLHRGIKSCALAA